MSTILRLLKKIDRKTILFVICLLLPFLMSPLAVSIHQESRCGYVLLITACYWLLEPVPVAATALIPVILCPLLNVVGSKDICGNYMKESLMMFIGGLIVAVAVEDCKLHERIALKVLLLVGTKIQWMLLGFMSTTMFLSMWVSNTATTAMMVPIVEAIVKEMFQEKNTDIELKEKGNLQTESKHIDNLELEQNCRNENSNEYSGTEASSVRVALLLSVCYAANIGGTGTLTGTGPNLVFKGLLEELHPESEEITFATWMMYNIPGMLLCVVIGWFYLWIVYIRCSRTGSYIESNENIKKIISEKYAALGSISIHEGQVIILFLLLVLLWIFRDPKFIPGWSEVIGSHSKIGDSVPAISIAFLLFFLPADPRNIRGRSILEWRTAQSKLPWGVLILAGGGFALADAANKSGLSRLVGTKLSSLNALPAGGIVALICFMTAMLTEIMTNTTTATIFLPVISQMAVSININPLYMMLPVTVVCSYAFMLPVATPPNAIAFESGKMKTLDMAKPGLVMNLLCCSVQLLMINTLGVAMFDLHTFPDWVQINNLSNSSNLTKLPNNSTIENLINTSEVINGT